MMEYVGLRAKVNSHVTMAGQTKKANGVWRCVRLFPTMHLFMHYKDCLLNHVVSKGMRIFRRRLHRRYSIECCKKPLSAQDDKRHTLEDGISTFSHGHYRILK